MTEHYDNIVFDLGGVVLDIDRDRCVDRLRELGLTRAAELLDLYKQQGDFLALEEGSISAARFSDILRSECSCDVTDDELRRALDSFITDLPVRRLEALRALRREGKRTFVLSNTNPIMFHSVIDRLFRQESLAIGDYFDGIVTSFQEKVCKPDAGIFLILIRRYGLEPAKTLFIDDSQANVAMAEACGLKGLLLPKNTDFIEFLNLSDDGK